MENRKDVFLALICTFVFISSYYIMQPVLPLYMERLGGSTFEIGFIMGIFFIVSLLARPVSGQIVDKLSSKKIMKICLGLFAVTPSIYFIAPNIWVVGFLQILYGVIIAGFTISTMTYISLMSPPAIMAQTIGLHSIAFMMSKNVGPAMGVKAWEEYGLLGALVLSTVFAIIGGIIILILKEPSVDRSKVEGQSMGMIFKVASMKRVYLPALALFFGMIAFGGININLSLFAEKMNIEGISTFFLIKTVIVLCIRLVAGRIGNKYIPFIVTTSLVFLSAALLMMSFATTIHHLYLVAIIYGIGFAGLFPFLTVLVVAAAPSEYRGKAVGIYTAASDLSTSVGSIFFGISEYIGFGSMFRLLALAPLIGILVFRGPCLSEMKSIEGVKKVLSG